ncbi:MAG: hypothetical protein ETSY1_27160 [Candidatus Entotheonella factor]|uniref:Uncharacterized protein n=1 Tax=Entotheonella factor TaxID=1429438 RepID=W4LEB4_ENTF1|nr:hypothetical protein [Candidatus Entotheonella palauensis]ETW96302.1 MAG: hypothetical protein ETSY1_27160 [Candidatus Entotheonella factor]
MLIFGTLGPAGSNHDWVTQRYLDFHRLSRARIELFSDFDDAFEAMFRGQIHHVIQVAVHPSVTSTVAKYRGRAHLIDTFISPSQPMAVLTRSEVDTPSTLGLQMATRDYIDTSPWPTLVSEVSTVTVAQGLLAGKYDSGLTLLAVAEQHPDRFRVDEIIGTVDDAWLVYGPEPTCQGHVQAWPDSPAAALFRRSQANPEKGARDE